MVYKGRGRLDDSLFHRLVERGDSPNDGKLTLAPLFPLPFHPHSSLFSYSFLFIQ